ncbi:hypothetical protein, partial [Streptomyces sp. P17]|uniref:hypothetical protein n=1 Tax=Streptomyces sp. P17 TaxID=3074716 RepID=UPI0028F4556C
ALSDYEANTPDADKRTPEQKNTIAALTKAAAEFDQFKLELLGGIGSDGKPVAPTLSLSSILKQYQAAAAMKDGSGVF